MQSSKYCPKCGRQNTILLSDTLGKPFTLENKPSIPRQDALHAGIHYHGAGPLFSSGICDDCGAWFAIFGIPPDDDVDEEKT